MWIAISKLARCCTPAQRSLRANGFEKMADVLNTYNTAISWEEARRRGAPSNCEMALDALTRNLNLLPAIAPPLEEHDLFLEGTEGPQKGSVWHFRLPAYKLSANWIPFMHREVPERAFRTQGQILVKIPNCAPSPATSLRRILVRCPKFSGLRLHMGNWNEASPLISQFKWNEGSALLNSSTLSSVLCKFRITQALTGLLLSGKIN